MINQTILEMLKRKVSSGEITVDRIINPEYKAAIETWLAEQQAQQTQEQPQEPTE